MSSAMRCRSRSSLESTRTVGSRHWAEEPMRKDPARQGHLRLLDTVNPRFWMPESFERMTDGELSAES